MGGVGVDDGFRLEVLEVSRRQIKLSSDQRAGSGRPRVRRSQCLELAAPIGGIEFEIAVGRLEACGFRSHPNLQQMRRLFLRGIELAVRDAGSRAHVLNHVRRQRGAPARVVLVRDSARQDPGENFHIIVRMRSKSHPRRDAVFIDYAQTAKAHVRPIVILRKGEGVSCIQPAMVGAAPFI